MIWLPSQGRPGEKRAFHDLTIGEREAAKGPFQDLDTVEREATEPKGSLQDLAVIEKDWPAQKDLSRFNYHRKGDPTKKDLSKIWLSSKGKRQNDLSKI